MNYEEKILSNMKSIIVTDYSCLVSHKKRSRIKIMSCTTFVTNRAFLVPAGRTQKIRVVFLLSIILILLIIILMIVIMINLLNLTFLIIAGTIYSVNEAIYFLII